MGMFPERKLTTIRPPLGAKQTFSVRYRGGKKPFDALEDARAFAKAERSNEGGWAEITQVIEKVIDPR
ncbi:hypothetical protein [Novosphingobium panipatense]|uniref:Uncharacterized protein n=1 Tax=Novosphingobium panipatense TaxID=428991 RepID=A0ABY1Q3U8_9SPHN|nr:hypothetical protein [Novosphingobium panipatense]SMP58518.1 hypothetical protein SAMN06296065_102486 [Novosphingobium panipatense]